MMIQTWTKIQLDMLQPADLIGPKEGRMYKDSMVFLVSSYFIVILGFVALRG